MEDYIYRNRIAHLRETNMKYRRIMVVMTFLLLILFFSLIITYKSAASEYTVESYESIMVSPGDTLWSLAEEYKAPDTGTRYFVRQLKKLNHKSDFSVAYGEYLIVPVYSAAAAWN